MAQLDAVRRRIRLAVKQAYTESNTARYQITAQERLLESSRLKLQSTRTGHKYGIRNNLDVIQAQQQLAEAEQQLAQAKYRYLTSYLMLLKESGIGMEHAWRYGTANRSRTAVGRVKRSRKQSVRKK